LGETEAWRLASSVINIILIVLVAGACLAAMSASFLVPVVAPGLEEQKTAIHLMRVMSPLIISIGLIGLSTAIINAYEHFVFPAFAGLLSNVSIISIVLLLANRLDIASLALGTVVGSLLHLLIQSIVLIRQEKIYLRIVDFSHPGVKRIFLLLLPLFIGLSVGQINLLVDRVMASGLVEGSISALNFAVRVMELPLAIFGVAVGVAIFPILAQQVVRNELGMLRETFSWGLRMVWFVTIPATLGLIVLREPLIRLLFERGAFDQIATQMTATALLFYSLSIFSNAALVVITRTYFSLQDTITPAKIGVVAVLVNIVLNLILLRYFAHGGLALATSIAAAVNLLLLMVYLRKKLGQLDGKRILFSAFKISFASLVMGVTCQLVLNLSNIYFEHAPGLLNQIIQVGGIAVLGTLVYLTISVLIKSEELIRMSEMRYFQRLGLEKIIKKACLYNAGK